MPLADCLTAASNIVTPLDRDNLLKERDALVKKGMSEIDADRQVKNRFIEDTHKKLFDNLNALKKVAKLSTEKYDKPDNSKEIASIHDNYNKQIKEVNKKYANKETDIADKQGKLATEKKIKPTASVSEVGGNTAESKQEKVNDLIDLSRKYNGVGWQNKKIKAAQLNKIKLIAKDLGLTWKEGRQFIELRNSKGSKITKKTGGNKQEVDFDENDYPQKTKDFINAHIDGGNLHGLAINGEDGKQMSDSQAHAALDDLRNGKKTAGAKAVYDALHAMSEDGYVKFRNETPNEVPTKIEDYLKELNGRKLTDADDRRKFEEVQSHIQNIEFTDDEKNAIDKIFSDKKITDIEQLIHILDNPFPNEGEQSALQKIRNHVEESVQQADQRGESKSGTDRNSEAQNLEQKKVIKAFAAKANKLKDIYETAQEELKSAEDRLSQKQVKQTDLLNDQNNAVQGGMFGIGVDESKPVIKSLREKVNKAKEEYEKADQEWANAVDRSQQDLFNENKISSQINTTQDAIQIGISKTLPVDETPGDSKKMGGGISEPEKPATPQAEKTSPESNEEKKLAINLKEEIATKGYKKAMADFIRSKKIDNTGKLKSEIIPTFGLPEKLANRAIDLIAEQVEKGTKLGNAIAKVIAWVDKQLGGKRWDKGAFGKHISKTFVMKVNGKDEVVHRDDTPETAKVIDGFYSPLEQRILDVKENGLPANKWAERLSSDEAKWTGTKEWLESQGNKPLSKEAVLQHMKDNRIQIVEVVKGSKTVPNYSIENEPPSEFGASRYDLLGALAAAEDINNPRFEKYLDQKYGNGDKILSWLKDNVVEKGSYIKEEDTKFSQYVLAGEKSNYKEVLIIMPVINKGDKLDQLSRRVYGQSQSDIDNQFKSSHFDEPNILAHVRMNTRTDAEGKKVLFIEEVQSDWGQKGKKEGFSDDIKFKQEGEGAEEGYVADYKGSRLVVLKNSKGEYMATFDGRLAGKFTTPELAQKELINQTKAKFTPSAPFVTDTNQWTKLGLKYALRHGVDEGADKVAWTTGEQQNERYDLSKQVDEILYAKTGDTYSISAQKDGKPVMAKEKVKPTELEGIIGKEIAAKIINGGNDGNIHGENLKLEGKGMKGFYGEPSEGKEGIIGGVAKALVKELTGKEGKIVETKISKGTDDLSKSEALDLLKSGEKIYTYNRGTIYRLYDERDISEATNYHSKKGEAQSTQHSIEITPELKASVEGGMPLFSESKSAWKIAADNIRKGKIGNDIAMSSIPFAKEVWNGALDIMAEAVERTGDFIEATQKAIKYIKDSDWYQNLTAKDKKEALETFNNEFTNDYKDKFGEGIGIKHAATAELREEHGLPEYERNPETVAEWDAEADKRIANGEMPDLLRRMKNEEPISHVEQRMMGKYIATLNDDVANNPNRGTLKLLDDAMELSDRVGGSMWGRAGVARQGSFLPENSLGSFLLEKKNSQGASLSDVQIKEQTEKYNELKKAKENLEAALKVDQDKNAKRVSEIGLNKAKAEARKAGKKSHETHLKIRKDAVEAAREALKKLRTGESGITARIPVANELIAIAPHIKTFVKDLLEEGVSKLDDAINDVYTEFKDVLEGLNKTHIRDIIGGQYDEKTMQTRNEKLAQSRLMQREANLLKTLALERKGEKDAKTETKRVEKSRRITELENKIKEVRKVRKEKENAETLTDDEYNTRRQKQLMNKVEKLRDEIKNKKYLEEKKQKPVFVKSRETQFLEDRVITLEHQRLVEIKKDEYQKLSGWRKAYDKVMNFLGIKRVVQTAIDTSIWGRQLRRVTFNPRKIDVTAKFISAGIKSVFNQKNYDRIMYAIHKSPDFNETLEDGIKYNELDAVNPNERNEMFQKSFITEIPIAREPIIASQRIADASLNTARYELYQKYKRNLLKQGITRESDPKTYNSMAELVMNMTGSGKLLKGIERNPNLNRILGNTFYGAKLMASNFNMLNPYYYFKIPQGMRVELMKDILSYTSTTVALGLAAVAAGAKLSLNPDDSDFMQLRWGDKVYDLTGGQVSYIRTGLRILEAAGDRVQRLPFINTKTEKEADAASKFAAASSGRFLLNKLAPNTSFAFSEVFGGAQNSIGEDVTPLDLIKIYPMYTDDMIQATKEDGWTSLLTILLPNVVGIGESIYGQKQSGSSLTHEQLKQPEWQFIQKKVGHLPTVNINSVVVPIDDNHPEGHLDDKQILTEDNAPQDKSLLKPELKETEADLFKRIRNEKIQAMVKLALDSKQIPMKNSEGKILDWKEFKELDKMDTIGKQKIYTKWFEGIEREATEETKKDMGLVKEKNRDELHPSFEKINE